MMNNKKLTIGILAHVDAGKTTLAESMLFLSGSIRTAGRVDHKDTLFDHYEMERGRGITIFSKCARIRLPEHEITLLDTPGHTDFSSETERAMYALDYAVFVIDGAEGLKSHTKTLWKLLKHYQIPAFVFVNKMDRAEKSREEIAEIITEELDDACMDLTGYHDRLNTMQEELAMCDEALLERHLNGEMIGTEDIRRLILHRKLYPVFFGCALHMDGVEEFLEAIDELVTAPSYPDTFSARAYKISRDADNTRLTHLKITGGTLHTKDEISDDQGYTFKVNQIRIYEGERYTAADEASAGTVCAVTGADQSFAGEGFGQERSFQGAVLEPMIAYQVILPDTVNVQEFYKGLKKLAEEEPQLHASVTEQTREITVRVMGQVQLEVLRHLIRERLGAEVSFGTGSVVYKETVTETTVGIGHFEPLRHYAEVHLLIEPAKRGSGIITACDVSEDVLARHWQRLIMTHIRETVHPGVLTGAELTDVKITLIAGKAHKKHTEPGDFREATYRAIRQGLMQVQPVLLEPYYRFRMELPPEKLGRAIGDIRQMSGSFETPGTSREMAVITGSAPAVCMQDYAALLASYTSGAGRLYLSFDGYAPCHNPQEVTAASTYDAENDYVRPADSVFCSHGSGVIIPWDQVPYYAHVESPVRPGREKETVSVSLLRAKRKTNASADSFADEEELLEIFERTYGKPKEKTAGYAKTVAAGPDDAKLQKAQTGTESAKKDSYLLVDGYNIIFAWEEVKTLTDLELEGARNALVEILANYRGFRDMNLIVVFDAYRVSGGTTREERYHGVDVVYTKEAETADQYIERVSKQLGKTCDVTVATSDHLEQMIIYGHGARRMSAGELKEEIERTSIEIGSLIGKSASGSHRLFDGLDEKNARLIEEIRLGRQSFQ